MKKIYNHAYGTRCISTRENKTWFIYIKTRPFDKGKEPHRQVVKTIIVFKTNNCDGASAAEQQRPFWAAQSHDHQQNLCRQHQTIKSWKRWQFKWAPCSNILPLRSPRSGISNYGLSFRWRPEQATCRWIFTLTRSGQREELYQTKQVYIYYTNKQLWNNRVNNIITR